MKKKLNQNICYQFLSLSETVRGKFVVAEQKLRIYFIFLIVSRILKIQVSRLRRHAAGIVVQQGGKGRIPKYPMRGVSTRLKTYESLHYGLYLSRDASTRHPPPQSIHSIVRIVSSPHLIFLHS